jgi:outer membrane protein TolC
MTELANKKSRNRSTNPTEPFLYTRTQLFKLSAISLSLVLSGCMSIQPMALFQHEIKQQSQVDIAKAQAEVEPINSALTLEDAIARALKYNLDARTRMMEEAVARNQYDLSKFDLLPQLTASAGYTRRNEPQITDSINLNTGQESVDRYLSSSPEQTLYDAGLTWNLLDFGVSYYNAKQNSDRVLIASERRRKATHTLIQDVRTVFWRASAAQTLQVKVKETIGLAESALKDSRVSEEERIHSPLEALRYQRQLLDNIRLLEAINNELSTARTELASLINAPLGSQIEVVEPDESVNTAILDVPLEQLEELAIMRNADVREQFYNTRIAAQETRKTIVKLFPRLALNYNVRYSTDDRLVNQNWNEAGANISFNLFNLLSAPTHMRLAEAGIDLADQRRMATQMAVLAQVNLARIQYVNALNQFKRADAMWDVDSRISTHMVNRGITGAQSKLELVASEATGILTLLRRYQALAALNGASSKFQATLGMEPEIASLHQTSLDELTGSISAALQAWDAGQLPNIEGAESAGVTKASEVEEDDNNALESPLVTEEVVEATTSSEQADHETFSTTATAPQSIEAEPTLTPLEVLPLEATPIGAESSTVQADAEEVVSDQAASVEPIEALSEANEVIESARVIETPETLDVVGTESVVEADVAVETEAEAFAEAPQSLESNNTQEVAADAQSTESGEVAQIEVIDEKLSPSMEQLF